MGNQLRPGSFTDTVSTTMAKAMETAFIDQWPHFNPSLPLPDEKQLQAMRLLFVAAAQGVVQHLRDNPAALQLAVQTATHSHDGGSHVHGDGSHTHTGGSHSHTATVDQISTTGTTQ